LKNINVKKWNKTRELYDRAKLVRTLQKYRLSPEEIEDVLQNTENRLYDGVTTKKILAILHEEIEHSQIQVKKSDLRAALGAMKSAPDFEIYVQKLFRGLGYDVTPNRVIQGHCVTHEIDGVAVKDGKQYYIETKHHSKTHNLTPFIDSLAVKAKLDDIRNGYDEGKNRYDFEGALLICNTRMTEHASDYSRCVGIEHIGWNTPVGNGIDAMIERSRVFPFTVLPTLTKNEARKLSSIGVITVQDILNVKTSVLGESRVKELSDYARQLIE
jgi:hypothetical protein